MAANPAPAPVPATLAEKLVDDWVLLPSAAVPEAVLARAALCVKDTIGVALAARKLGVGLAATRVVLEADGARDACLWGAPGAASAEDAAFANGMLAHALDFDDTHAAAIMHSSAVVVPAGLALGEATRASGRELLAALVAGYQVAARLGRLAPGPFQDHGFQATSVLGAFAAAAVASRLLGLRREETLHALGIVGSMAGGLMEYLADGSDVKQMHPGWAALSGIRAARLARAGFRGPRTVFEGKFGAFRSFAGVDLGGRWRDAGGAPWEVELMAPKPYPACLCVHAGVQAILALRAEGVVGPDRLEAIESIHCEVPEWYVNLIFEPREAKAEPRTPYEARFSGPWCIARALVDGGLDVWSFTPGKIADPRVLALARRVTYAVQALPEFPAAFPARVSVRLHDGAEHTRHVGHNLGTPGNPMSAADIGAKFDACAIPAVGGPAAAAISRALDALAGPAGPDGLYGALRRIPAA